MGASYLFKCSKCDYSFSTSGPWEFYRNKKGNRKPYGHPCPSSKEARIQGIYGLSGELYCIDCDKIIDIILVEYKQPSNESLFVWSGKLEPKDEYKREGAIKCPDCNGTGLVLQPIEDLLCPRCKEGRLIGDIEWIS